MRKLASVQRITEITPIKEADNIETASVLGWKSVIRKQDNFQAGDLIVFVEIDSLFPPMLPEPFRDLEGKKVKTRIMRGQISQGIVLPLSILEESLAHYPRDIFEGDDVSDLLEIVKYELPMYDNSGSKTKGDFPSFIPKTDEVRIENMTEYLATLKEEPLKCYITEKIDGTSITFYLNEGVFGVCSRNRDLLETPSCMYWKVAREFHIEEKMRRNNDINIAIQGELYGEGIQGNPLKMKGKHVRFFSVYSIDMKKFYPFYSFQHTIVNLLGLYTVPVIDVDYELTNDIEDVKQLTMNRRSHLAPLQGAEGIVLRPMHETYHPLFETAGQAGRVSMKAINPQYLLAHNL